MGDERNFGRTLSQKARFTGDTRIDMDRTIKRVCEENERKAEIQVAC